MNGPAGEARVPIILGFFSGSLAWAVSTTSPMLTRRQLDFRIWNMMGGRYKWCHQLEGGD